MLESNGSTFPWAFGRAADPAKWTPPADDSSLGILREVFGNIVDFVIGNGVSAANLSENNTVIASGFEVFNTAILFLAMIFVAYSSIMGVINTAHDGEFLGRKMSSIWVPLRTVGGSALLLPLAGGFSLIQIVILWLTLQGVGIGDKAWTAMLGHIDQSGMINHPAIPNARPLVANILRSEVCMAAMNKQYAESDRTDRIDLVELKSSRTQMVPTDDVLGGTGANALGLFGVNYKSLTIPVTSWSWAARNGSYIRNDVCGGISWDESSESQAGNARYLDVAKISTAHTAAVRDVILAIRPVAASIVAGHKPNSDVILSTAYAYENKLRQAAKAAVDSGNKSRRSAFIDYAKNGGWVFAGSYYNHIISLNDSVQLAVNSLPTSTSIDIQDKESQEALYGFRDAMTVTEEFLKHRSQSAAAAYANEKRLDTDACKSPIPTGWDEIRTCLSKPALAGIELMAANMAGSNTSHVAQVKAVGDTIMAVAWTQAGVFAIAGGVADAKLVDYSVGSFFSLKGALGSVSVLVNMLVLSMLTAGTILAFYVPMIPFITWTVGVIKWLVSVAEAMVAAPIFAAAHIHPDGDEAVGRAGPGYTIILSTVLRPILMLFGLILSIAVAQPIAHFVNAGFMLAVKGSMHDSANGLGAFVAYCVIYMIIMTTVLHSVFALIHWIPDNTMRWMGSAVGMGGVGDREEGESHQVFAGAARQGRNLTTGPKAPPGGGRMGTEDGPEPPSGSTRESDHAQVPRGGG
ncbi:conjugal transfer protein TraY [Xanthomonas arboricola pv. populi]|uniref:Conjugal transfer protein TraY n=1 Tax=Xanthomonas arboricola pv. populi TaxID=487823 RepID=A0A2S6Z0B7_9XANT|nr:DotA/TraY family protein [Xanthomonas arboricola]PPT73847.1 conjugal transfer protein TraY [Xanthomonas arboricola pv. populi]